MIGDFNYDTFKTSSFKSMNIESESFTNRPAEFNMHKLIHKPTRVKPPSATLLDNIYTNIQITVDSCKLGILTSNISDHFFGFFDIMKINQTQNYTRKIYFTQKNIANYWACRPCGAAGWLALKLTKAGDVETNPGPTTLNKKVWICDICHKQIHVRKQISIRCNRIEHWVHLRCAGIRQAQNTDTWTCHLHRESRLTPHTDITPPQRSRPLS